MNDDQTPKDEGSVWASYSDLFTNVAIIFLVMFVFALLKSGISKMETAAVKKKHSNELKGKLSEKELAKSKEKIKKVEESIKEMQKVETLVDDKIREIQHFAKTMEQNKVILKDLIEEQKKKDSMLNSVHTAITQKEELIKNLQDEKEKLDKTIHQIETRKLSLEVKLKEKDNKTFVDEEKIKSLQQELIVQKEDKSTKEMELKNLMNMVSKSQITIDSIEKHNQELSEKIKASEANTQVLQNNKQLMQEKIYQMAQSKSKMDKTIAQLENRVRQEEQQGESLLKKLGKSESDQQSLRDSYQKLNKNMEAKMAEINYFKDLHEKTLAQVGSVEDQLKYTQEKMRNLGRALQEMKGKLRSSVADSLKRKMRDQNLNVIVDSDTGNITLLMDDNFLFQKNSHELSDKAQVALSQIAPIYSEVIFGDENVSTKIENIEITGHASPSFKKRYVDPKGDHPDAYAHNMRLSAQRAASIANYMVGSKIGNYPLKSKMRDSIFAIGRSYISPVEKPKIVGRDLASVDDTCGPYDCSLSQRVEIGFRLKDDMKAIEKLIQMAGAK